MTPDDLAPWDPLWTDAPRRWGEGPWSGNGTLGALVYVHPAHPDRLRVETGHAAACMARPGLDPADSCRIPVGHLDLVLPGPVTGGSARLHLAEGGWTVVPADPLAVPVPEPEPADHLSRLRAPRAGGRGRGVPGLARGGGAGAMVRRIADRLPAPGDPCPDW